MVTSTRRAKSEAAKNRFRIDGGPLMVTEEADAAEIQRRFDGEMVCEKQR